MGGAAAIGPTCAKEKNQKDRSHKGQRNHVMVNTRIWRRKYWLRLEIQGGTTLSVKCRFLHGWGHTLHSAMVSNLHPGTLCRLNIRHLHKPSFSARSFLLLCLGPRPPESWRPPLSVRLQKVAAVYPHPCALSIATKAECPLGRQ